MIWSKTEPAVTKYLKAGDATFSMFCRRCSFIMEGKKEKADYIDQHILPELEKTEQQLKEAFLRTLDL